VSASSTHDQNAPASGKRVAPYGSWRSPITGDVVATAGVGLGWLQTAGEDVFWVELRPLEEGRYVVVRRRPDGVVADVTPPGFNARTLVHEYGGGAAAVAVHEHGATVWFANFADQRLSRQDVGDVLNAEGRWGGGAPQAITPPPETERGLRYADGRPTPDGRLLVWVRERHPTDGSIAGVVNELVVLPADGSAEPHVIVTGHDFSSSPRISPDGRRLAWLQWDHPNMPWDGTELWVAELAADGSVRGERKVAGGPDESIVQPGWSPDGVLHYISDRSGWWNIYRAIEATADVEGEARSVSGRHEPVAALAAEFAKPSWVFGLQNYAFLSDGRMVVFYSKDGLDHLALLDERRAVSAQRPAPALAPLSDAYTSISYLAATGGRAWIIGGSPTQTGTVVAFDVATGDEEQVRQSHPHHVDAGYISTPRPLEFPTEGGLTAHALFYPPANKDYEGPAGELPPLLVVSHGGPTSAAEARLVLELQYWTSHGFAVVDVNYGGSSGYGRAYRRRLAGLWGVVDVDDCVNAALALARAGEVDGARLAVRGGSAGGWTTLCCLAFRDVFAAGASHFGVAELERFVQDTHKFESRYIEGLVGPWPQAAALFRERAPLYAADRIRCPVIILQGLEDKIVPPSQAEIMVAALAENHVPYAYVIFPGEQHGYRKAESIKRALEVEHSFYAQVFGFEPGEPLERVNIENLA
jgi:dipeptidyl aminopeptidase/acylaminoacyl peptidase